MQIYYLSNFLNNLTGGHFEVLTLIGLILIIMGIIGAIRNDGISNGRVLIGILILVIGVGTFIMVPVIKDINLVYQNVINKSFESILDQDDAFIHTKTYEIDKNKKQVYLESKSHSFHKSLVIENVDGKNIITKED